MLQRCNEKDKFQMKFCKRRLPCKNTTDFNLHISSAKRSWSLLSPKVGKAPLQVCFSDVIAAAYGAAASQAANPSY